MSRVPPHAAAAEEALVGAALLSREATADARGEGLRPEHFYVPAAAAAWASVCALAERGDPVDVVTVAAELAGGDPAKDADVSDRLLRWMADTPSTGNAANYARLVIDCWTARRVIDAGRAVAEAGWTLPGPEAVAAAAEAVAPLAEHPEGGPVELGESLDPLMARWEAQERGEAADRAIGFGIPRRDAKVSMRPGELVVVGARTAVGKTSLLLLAAAHAARTGPVVVFSLEMTSSEVAARMLGHAARAPLNTDYPRLDADGWGRIRAAIPSLIGLPLWIDEHPSRTVADITFAASRVRLRHGPLALVVVDYAQLVATPGEGNRQEAVSQIVRGLKTAARTLDCPVLAASQLRRPDPTKRNERPRLEDLRESGSIEQDADTVLLLHRPDGSGHARQFHGDTAPPEPLEARIAKNRHGPAHVSVNLAWYPAWAHMDDPEHQQPRAVGPSERLPYRD